MGETEAAPRSGSLLIRKAAREDLDVLFEMSQESFASEPWTREGVLEEIDRESSLCEVVEMPGHGVVGLLMAWRVADELHLLRIATRPGWRRQGIGGRLLDRLLEVACEESASVCYLEVRASNLAARALYETRGFKIVGVRKAYYVNPAEDAVLMAWLPAG